MPDPAPRETSTSRLATLQRRWAALPGNLRGGLWVLISTLFFSLMIVAIKIVGQRLHVTEILFFRQMVMIVVALPVILRGWPGSMQSARVDLQMFRIIAAFGAMLMGFTAVINLPLADATTLAFGKTFFMTILAIIFLHEVVGVRRWSAVFVGFAGVVIVAWPQPGAAFNVYAMLAIASAACVAVVMVIIRKLSQVDQPVTILTYQAIGVGLLMLPPTIYFWKTPTFHEALLIGAIGLLSALGQTCNILGLRAGEASAVAPLDYTRLLFALLFGWLIFSEWPDPRVFVGATLIIGAAVYTLHRERALGRKGRAEAKIETANIR